MAHKPDMPMHSYCCSHAKNAISCYVFIYTATTLNIHDLIPKAVYHQAIAGQKEHLNVRTNSMGHG